LLWQNCFFEFGTRHKLACREGAEFEKSFSPEEKIRP
jgi:hypothetical protein